MVLEGFAFRGTENTDGNEWDFSFTIPFNCDGIERSSVSSPSFFNTDLNQPLPTTFGDINDSF